MKRIRSALTLLLAAALALGLLAPASAAYQPPYQVSTVVATDQGRRASLSRGFAVGAQVIRGDEKGRANWDQTLTRAEAATMLVRLMDLEDEAEQAKNKPCYFTDVPKWAVGYVNVAYEKGIAKGVGAGRFDPSAPCDQRAFLTMLYRLTHLKEGTDYTWATCVDDFAGDVKALSACKGRYWPYQFDPTAQIDQMTRYFKAGGAFTRQAACDALYFMMSIQAGPQGESLGDIMAQEYGMSDLLLYDHEVRRTAYGLRGESEIHFWDKFGVPGDTVLSVRDGKLTATLPEGADRGEFSLRLSWLEKGVPCGQAVELPRQRVSGTLKRVEQIYSGYTDEGYLTWSVSYDEEFYIDYADGTWSIAKWDFQENPPDCALIHAYRSEDYRRSLARACAEESGTPSPEIRALAAQLTAGKKTEMEKGDAICEWVATHIYYEYAGNGVPAVWQSQAADTVLARRRGVCQGYANLTQALMRAAGLKCCLVYGSADGGGHAWNAAQLDGKWVLIDNTWDSSLTYDLPAGSGFRYLHEEIGLNGVVWEKRAPQNYLEPNAKRDLTQQELYFDMDWDELHATHTLDRDPIYGNEVTVWEGWKDKYR